jgi:hypothetical protein
MGSCLTLDELAEDLREAREASYDSIGPLYCVSSCQPTCPYHPLQFEGRPVRIYG